MKVQITTQKDFTVIHIHGRIDTMTAGDFETHVLAAIESGTTKLLLDCSGLDYISSSGLRVFLVAQKKLTSAMGLVRLCCLQPTIKEIFDISGFSNIFAIFPNIEEATTT